MVSFSQEWLHYHIHQRFCIFTVDSRFLPGSGCFVWNLMRSFHGDGQSKFQHASSSERPCSLNPSCKSMRVSIAIVANSIPTNDAPVPGGKSGVARAHLLSALVPGFLKESFTAADRNLDVFRHPSSHLHRE